MGVEAPVAIRRPEEKIVSPSVADLWQDGEYLPGRFDRTHEYVTRPTMTTADYYLALVTFRRLRGEEDGPLPLVKDIEFGATGKEVL